MIAVIVPNCLMAGKWMIIVLERRVPRRGQALQVLRHSLCLLPLLAPRRDQRLVEEAEDSITFHATLAPRSLFKFSQVRL